MLQSRSRNRPEPIFFYWSRSRGSSELAALITATEQNWSTLEFKLTFCPFFQEIIFPYHRCVLVCCRSNKLIAAEITQNINKDFYICLQFFFAFMHSLVAIEKSARLTLKTVWCMCVCVVSKVIRIECLYRGHCAIFYEYSTVSCPYKCTLEAVDFHRSRIGDLRHLHLETHNSLAFLYTLSRIRI